MEFIKKLFGIKPREPKFDVFDKAILNEKPVKITGIKEDYYGNREFLGYEYRKIDWNGFELEDSFFNSDMLDKDLEYKLMLRPFPRLKRVRVQNIFNEELSPNGIVLKVEFKIKVESQKTPIKLTVEPEVVRKTERVKSMSQNYDPEFFVSELQEVEANGGAVNLHSLSDPETLALNILKEKHNRVIKPEKVLEVQYKIKTRPQYRIINNVYYKEVE